MLRRRSGDLAAAAGFAILTALWLLPIFRHLNTVIPGQAAGDNVTFVWNLWWMRYVLHHPQHSFFFTSFLFYPFGVDLTLHTHTALPALAAALAGPSSLIAAQNLIVGTHVYLNFLCAYALAYRLSRHTAGAAVAALVFGASPFVCARLEGHFNLLAAWIIPLVVLVRVRLLDSPGAFRALLLGAAIGAAPYLDYYLFVYSVILLALLGVSRSIDVRIRPARPSVMRRSTLGALVALMAADALLIGWILITGGRVVEILGRRTSVQSVGNPLTFAWLLGIGIVAVFLSARIKIRICSSEVAPCWRTWAIVAGSAAVFLIPLLAHAFALWRSGTYVSQPYFWRSAPSGVDVATFVIGSPFNALWGGVASRAYSRLQIDLMEACCWMSPAAVILAAAAVRLRRQELEIREWLAAGAVFLIWALGPWVMIAGHRSPLILPTIGIRYIPILANARIPGRAMVVVVLALAVLSAVGVASLAAMGRRRLQLLLIVLVVVDLVPAAPHTFRLAVPALYRDLAAAPGRAAVIELPMGVRSGTGETGHLDSAVLFYQTVHERPLVGGFVARLPASVARRYLDLPVLGSLLRLSAGESLDRAQGVDIAAAAHALTSQGIGYIVLDERAASADLIEYVRTRIALELLAEDDGRTLYRVGLSASRNRGANGTSDSTAQATK